MWPGTESNADTEIFNPVKVPGLCITIGRQLNEFERLTPLMSRSNPLNTYSNKYFWQSSNKVAGVIR